MSSATHPTHIRPIIQMLSELLQINNGYEFLEIRVELAESGDVINAWTCIARLDNEFYLGDADIEQMAGEIRRAKGCAGPNFE